MMACRLGRMIIQAVRCGHSSPAQHRKSFAERCRHQDFAPDGAEQVAGVIA
jgi:hypothetical protein